MTANIQLSGKADNGVIVVVGGDNYDDFYQNLLAVVQDSEVVDQTIASMAALVTQPSAGNRRVPQDTRNGQTGGGYQSDAPRQQPQRNQPTPPPGAQAEYCNHGQMEFKSGTGKNNKTWRAWMCPSPDRGDRCEPIWIR